MRCENYRRFSIIVELAKFIYVCVCVGRREICNRKYKRYNVQNIPVADIKTMLKIK